MKRVLQWSPRGMRQMGAGFVARIFDRLYRRLAAGNTAPERCGSPAGRGAGRLKICAAADGQSALREQRKAVASLKVGAASIAASACLWGGGGVALAKITPEQAKTLPPPANHPVDFAKEIKPIFEASCIKCHGRGRTKGDLSIESRETLLKGGESGPSIVPGASVESHLVELVAGLDPDNVMPQKGKRLTPEQIGLLRAWIDQGAPWDPSVNFAKAEPRNIDPRQPALPDTPAIAETSGASGPPGVQSAARVNAGRATLIPAHATDATPGNPIDRLLAPYFAERGITPGPLVDDRQFARRVYLDTIGLLPSPDALQAFGADRQPDKRQRLVAR